MGIPLTYFVLLISPFVGSFLGVLIDRLPVGGAVVLARSACPRCGRRIAPIDLVPLLSWLMLLGRCRRCRASIGWFHPAIEMAAIGVALWSVLVVPGWAVVETAVLGWTLLVLAVIDWRHMILPDVVTLPLAAMGITIAAVRHAGLPVDEVIGAALGAATLGTVAVGYERWTGRHGLGLGDAKLFAAAGAWAGWQSLPSVLLIGSAAGLAATAIVHRLSAEPGSIRGKDAIPFGPYLALGFWVTWLYGPVTLG